MKQDDIDPLKEFYNMREDRTGKQQKSADGGDYSDDADAKNQQFPLGESGDIDDAFGHFGKEQSAEWPIQADEKKSEPRKRKAWGMNQGGPRDNGGVKDTSMSNSRDQSNAEEHHIDPE